MGRDRVKKVGNNNIDLIANPKAKGERTQLYADGGRVSRRGYIALEQKKKWQRVFLLVLILRIR